LNLQEYSLCQNENFKLNKWFNKYVLKLPRYYTNLIFGSYFTFKPMFHHQSLESTKINKFLIKEGFQILKIYIFNAQDYLICDNIQFLFFFFFLKFENSKNLQFQFLCKIRIPTPLIQVFVKKTIKELTIL
jgi:hypothetical protein